MFTGRRTTEAVEGHEELVAGHRVGIRHWTVISADGVISHEERIAYEAELTVQTARMERQTWRLMAIDVWEKWSVRLRRRGLDRQGLRAIERDFEDLDRLRPASAPGVMVDPYGAMAAD